MPPEHELVRPPEGWEPMYDEDPVNRAVAVVMFGAAMVAANPPVQAVMTNEDHSVDQDVAEKLRAGGLFAQHSAWNCVGWVWWNDGRWHELVQVHGQARGSYSADTLEELMKTVNDEYGWE